MKRSILTYMLPLALIAVAIAGCVFTSTVVITQSVAPNSAGEPITIVDLGYPVGTPIEGCEQVINLSDNATFNDFKANIKNIDNIGFYLSVENNLYSPTEFQLFLVPDTSKHYISPQMLVDSLADLILTGLRIPAESHVTVDWNESVQYVTNLEYFKSTIESGVFSLYLAALDPNTGARDNFNLRIDSLVFIVTLTGKK
jgi:hypothetical protein